MLEGIQVACKQDLVGPASLITVHIYECIVYLLVYFVIHVVKFAVRKLEAFCDLENVGVHRYAVWLVEAEQSYTVGHFVSYPHQLSQLLATSFQIFTSEFEQVFLSSLFCYHLSALYDVGCSVAETKCSELTIRRLLKHL